jgi:alcohol dehydrogenase class IV
MWQYSNPVKIIHSENYTQSVLQITDKIQNEKILILSYNWFKDTKSFKLLTKGLKNYKFFGEIEENPSFSSCRIAVNEADSFQPNVIIAIGGGSVIDTAKIVRSSLYKQCLNIEKLLKTTGIKTEKALFIAIPTTHGTGSEVTMWATVWDKQNKVKHSLSEYENYPDYAIFDVDLVKNLPLSVSYSTTLDALSHSFEAVWNKNSNPISDNYAFKAIELIFFNLNKLSENTDLTVRKKLLLASLYAGLAFSNTKTAAAHSISYPLSAYFSIPHGIACSMPIYSLLKINYAAVKPKLSVLFESVNIKNPDDFKEKLFNPLQSKIRFSLNEYGFKESDISEITELCFTKGRMDNNIVDLDKNDVRKILSEIL